jgi:hypothetical protein
MAPTPENHGHELKRIVLPSGKTIEVVYFPSLERELADADGGPAIGESAAPADAQSAPAEGKSAPAEELHLCRECESDLVYPTAWEEAGPEHWQVDLRCPNCEWYGQGTWNQEVVEDFDEELDRGTEILTEDYKRLATANMADDIERFTQALELDAILPEDF